MKNLKFKFSVGAVAVAIAVVVILLNPFSIFLSVCYKDVNVVFV